MPAKERNRAFRRAQANRKRFRPTTDASVRSIARVNRRAYLSTADAIAESIAAKE